MKQTVTVYHVDNGSIEMYPVDANSAVGRFPNQYSMSPWTDEAATEAKRIDKQIADATAQRRKDGETAEAALAGEPKGRVKEGEVDTTAQAVKDPPPVPPNTAAGTGLAPSLVNAGIGGMSPLDEGAQPAVPQSDLGLNRPAGPVIDASVPDKNVPGAIVDDGPKANEGNGGGVSQKVVADNQKAADQAKGANDK